MTIFFDLDGTLADTSEDIATSLNIALSKFDIEPIQDHIIRSYIGDGVRPLIKKVLKSLGREDEEEDILKVFLYQYESNIANKTYIYDGIVELLGEIKARGMSNFVVTNKLEDLSIALLNRKHILQLFDGIIGGDTFEFKKPSRELLDKIKNRFKSVGEKIFVIGDGSNDFNFAKNIGATFIFAKWGFTPEIVEKEIVESNHNLRIFRANTPYDIIKNLDLIFIK